MIPARLEHLLDHWKSGFILRTEALFACFQIDSHTETDVIQQAGNDSGDDDGRVGDARQIGHNKSGCTHDWRQKWAARGGNSFHSAGKLGRIANFFHQRDGERARRDNVRHSGAVDGAHQRGGNHRRFCRAALHAAGQRVGDVNEELTCAERVEQLAEDDIQRDKRNACTDTAAEDGFARPGNIIRNFADSVALVRNQIRHIAAKVRIRQKMPERMVSAKPTVR